MTTHTSNRRIPANQNRNGIHMKHNRLLCLIISLFVSSVFAAPSNIKHVIYITLDGVRWQDIYKTQHYFPKFWDKYADKVTLYGFPNTNTTMEVASVPLSLPSYQSQMAGAVQPCRTNECGHIQVQTLPEALINEYHFAKKDVAIFGSWPEIAYAAETKTGTTYSNAGNLPVLDPKTNKPDSVMAAINQEQLNHHHSYKTNRLDKYTFSQSLHYFEKYQPRFMWIALVNADNEAHDGNKDQYHQMLSYYDDALDGLFNTLKAMHIDKETMVIVTTDHGRGNKENWTSHGINYPESRQTWAFVMNGKLQPISDDGETKHYSTLSIRPAIEKALL